MLVKVEPSRIKTLPYHEALGLRVGLHPIACARFPAYGHSMKKHDLFRTEKSGVVESEKKTFVAALPVGDDGVEDVVVTASTRFKRVFHWRTNAR